MLVNRLSFQSLFQLEKFQQDIFYENRVLKTLWLPDLKSNAFTDNAASYICNMYVSTKICFRDARTTNSEMFTKLL